jgi:hypothetical protein
MLKSLLNKIFSRPLTQEGFAKKFIESARKAGFDEVMDFQASEFRIRHNNGSYFNLHNAFRDYQNGDKAQKTGILNGYVSTLMESGRKRERLSTMSKPSCARLFETLACLRKFGWSTSDMVATSRTMSFIGPWAAIV